MRRTRENPRASRHPNRLRRSDGRPPHGRRHRDRRCGHGQRRCLGPHDPEHRVVSALKLGTEPMQETTFGGSRGAGGSGCPWQRDRPEPDLLLRMNPPTTSTWKSGVVGAMDALSGVAMRSSSPRPDNSRRDRQSIIELSTVYRGTFKVEGNYTEFLAQRRILGCPSRRTVGFGQQSPSGHRLAAAGHQGRPTQNTVEDTKTQSDLKATTARNEARTKPPKSISKPPNEKPSVCWPAFGRQAMESRPSSTTWLVLAWSTGGFVETGSDKTTLLRLMTRRWNDAGIKQAVDLRVVPSASTGARWIPTINWRPPGPRRHGRLPREDDSGGWAKRFLFEPDQLSTKGKLLSGGEQARVLIANLMLQPADVLLLDEPTSGWTSLRAGSGRHWNFGAGTRGPRPILLDRVSTEFVAFWAMAASPLRPWNSGGRPSVKSMLPAGRWPNQAAASQTTHQKLSWQQREFDGGKPSWWRKVGAPSPTTQSCPTTTNAYNVGRLGRRSIRGGAFVRALE